MISILKCPSMSLLKSFCESPHFSETLNLSIPLVYRDANWGAGRGGICHRSQPWVEPHFPTGIHTGETKEYTPQGPQWAPGTLATLTFRETFLWLCTAPSWPVLLQCGSSWKEQPEEGALLQTTMLRWEAGVVREGVIVEVAFVLGFEGWTDWDGPECLLGNCDLIPWSVVHLGKVW